MFGCYERRPYGWFATVLTMTTIRSSSSWSVGALAAAAVVGVAAGGLTACLQAVLSADWNTVANSGAVWTLIAAVAAGLLGRQPTTAAVAGLLVLVGEVVGYYAWVTQVDHLPVLRVEEALWTVAAVWIGPLAGRAAHAVRWGAAGERLVSLLAFAGVLAGEGAYLWRLAGVPHAGGVEVVVAAVGTATALVTVPAAWRWRALAGLAFAGVAAAVFAAYAQPLIA